MIIVSGYLVVAADQREAYLAESISLIRQARSTPGCREFSLSADLLDPQRIVVVEIWENRQALDDFRGDGVDEAQGRQILDAAVAEYDAGDARLLQ